MSSRAVGIVAGVLATAWVSASPAGATIIGVSGAGSILDPTTTPAAATADFFQDTKKSGITIHAWNEQQDVVLGQNITVDVVAPGTYKGGASAAVVIPSGTVVSSHLIDFDPKRNAGRKASFTFDSDIIGVIMSGQGGTGSYLFDTDFLGDPNVDYPDSYFSLRGLEPRQDVVRLSRDLRTISVKLQGYRAGDQIRVITLGTLPGGGPSGPPGGGPNDPPGGGPNDPPGGGPNGPLGDPPIPVVEDPPLWISGAGPTAAQVPLPSSLLLLAAGAVGAGVLARRRSRRK